MSWYCFLAGVLFLSAGCATSGTQVSPPATAPPAGTQTAGLLQPPDSSAKADSLRDVAAEPERETDPPASIEPHEGEIAPEKREMERRIPIVGDRVRRFVDWVKDRNPVPLGSRP